MQKVHVFVMTLRIHSDGIKSQARCALYMVTRQMIILSASPMVLGTGVFESVARLVANWSVGSSSGISLPELNLHFRRPCVVLCVKLKTVSSINTTTFSADPPFNIPHTPFKCSSKWK